MNSAHGEPTAATMPFDLAHMRFPFCFDCPPDADDAKRKSERKRLAAFFSARLRKMLVKPAEPATPFVAHPTASHLSRFCEPMESIGMGDATRAFSTPTPILMEPGAISWLRLMPRLMRVTPLAATAIIKTIRAGPVLATISMLGGGYDFLTFCAPQRQETDSYIESASLIVCMLCFRCQKLHVARESANLRQLVPRQERALATLAYE